MQDKLTPVTIDGLANAFLVVWEELGVNPTRAAVALKVAHVHLETGLRLCHCYNLGNLKWTSGDFCEFPCGEEVPLSKCPPLSDTCKIVKRYTRDGAPWVSLALKPPHPWCKFAAFEDLFAGARAQLKYLRNRPKVLTALMTGDALTYSVALRDARYFTADPALYAKILVQRLAIVDPALKGWPGWGDVQ